MTSPSNTVDAYLKTRVLTARPEQLRLMLLDGAIKFARQGQAGLRAQDYEASFEGFSQSRAIVMELIVTIESAPDPLLAGRVKSVLSFIYSGMVEASMNKDPDKMEEPIRLLEFERETWAMFIKDWSETYVAAHKNASKDAANKAAATLVIRFIASYLSPVLRDPAAATWAAGAIEQLDECHRLIELNVRPVFAFENWAAQIALAAPTAS